MILENKIYSIIYIVLIIFNLSPIHATNEKCYAEGKDGVCKDKSLCNGYYKPVPGYCKGLPNDIQCCIARHPTYVVQFIENISLLVIKEANSRKASGAKWVLPSVCIAQAALETGWGKSNLMIKANAYFGIKAGSNWKGKVYSSSTQECYDGVNYVSTTDTFRAYDSLEDSIKDYYDLITNNSRYDKACNVSDAETCITEIKNGGYATDPNYIKNVMSIINQYNLTQYDNSIISNTNVNPSSTTPKPCNDGKLTGVCINENQCDTVTSFIKSGLCLSQPNEIKCCLPKKTCIDKHENYENNGICIPTEQCDENRNTIVSVNQKNKPYWYGTFGQIGTQSLYNQQKKVYPKFYTANDYQDQIKLNVRVHDCIGLVKGYLWSETLSSTPVYNKLQDLNASMMYSKSTEKGPSSSFRKIIGQLVYKGDSENSIHHVGIYIGNDKVIEAKGHEYGVIESDYDSTWKYWSQCPYIINNTEHYCEDINSANIASNGNYTISMNMEDKFCEIVMDDDDLLHQDDKNNSDTSGAGNFKHFTFFSIFIVQTSFLIWQIHTIF
ncbi:Glucosaminidase-domain-containing protein [Neocallimastix lanati (nom. inval.)]|nr:Glucosaminidase-domain-containing protein [Neocallimastix sp. JGI-2020a]